MQNGDSLRGHKPLDTYGLTDTNGVETRSDSHETTPYFQQEFSPRCRSHCETQQLDPHAWWDPVLKKFLPTGCRS
jgi:ABC-type Zn uptake system ZnuABC Zn-binding protein ZnuA